MTQVQCRQAWDNFLGLPSAWGSFGPPLKAPKRIKSKHYLKYQINIHTKEGI